MALLRQALGAVLLLVAGASGSVIRAQGVLVAPHGVFMTAGGRVGAIELYNPGDRAVEVGVHAVYGTPATDTAGVVTMRFADSATTPATSAAAWVRVLPRRTVLPPRSRQTLRVLVQAPPGLAPGEYWARLVVDARDAAPVEQTNAPNAVAVGLTLQVRTVIALFYRVGQVTTGITVGDVQAVVAGDSLGVTVSLARQGTAAYLGVLRGTLTAPDGTIAGTFESTVGVYDTMAPRYTMPITALPAGTYQLAIDVGTDRKDLPADLVLQAPVAHRTLSVVVPPRETR